ncbi:transcription factor 7 isoform 2-T2 [Mantella aurantiaca]
MPQLNSGEEDDLGASDEMIAFKDEGDQEEKIQENAFIERDLADLKSSLVNESEISPATNTVDHPVAIRRAQDVQRVYQEKLADHMEDGAHRPSQTSDIPAFYSIPPGGVGQISPSMSWFTHPLMLGSGVHSTGIPHPAIVPYSGNKEMICYDRNMKLHTETKRERESKKPTIKKPLNAFMLYMKEMRAKVIAECTLKESAAINQIIGRRWHALSREEQSKYYELARKERQLHMQLYPGWSARDNYGKKKRRREKHPDSSSDPGSPKKCRARFGLNQQMDWCSPCRRKKKCIRYLQGEGRCSRPISSNGSAIESPSSTVDSLQSIEISACSSCTLTNPDDSAQSEKNSPPRASDKAKFLRHKALVSIHPSEEFTPVQAM